VSLLAYDKCSFLTNMSIVTLKLPFGSNKLLFQGEEGLVHFQWLDRSQNIVEHVSFFWSSSMSYTNIMILL
jgi:hypothetical protein